MLTRTFRTIATPKLKLTVTSTRPITQSAAQVHTGSRMSSSTTTAAAATAAASTTSTREWLVQIPDHENALDKRLQVRPTHLSNLKPDLDAGKIVFGGALLSEQPQEGEQPKMVGSVFLMKADSEEAVREWIRNDAYTKGGAWDAEKVQIWPFRCAVRTAM